MSVMTCPKCGHKWTDHGADRPATCQWGRMTRKGACGKLAVCDVLAFDDVNSPTCSEHMEVAKREGWTIMMRL